MSDPVLITIVTTIGGIIVAALGLIANDVKKVKKDAATSRKQTQNDHEVNLRDDLDQKHAAVMSVLNLHGETLNSLQRSDRNQWSAIERIRLRMHKRRWLG
jgi:hypothetical protein